MHARLQTLPFLLDCWYQLLVPTPLAGTDHYGRFLDSVRAQSLQDTVTFLPGDGDLATAAVLTFIQSTIADDNNSLIVYIADPCVLSPLSAPISTHHPLL